jgi:hypothetical protein
MEGLVWLVATALTLRCFFEAVMDPFYLGPPFALIVVACATRPQRHRLVVGSGTFVVASLISFHHLSEWACWTPIVALLALGLASAWPGRSAFRSDDVISTPESRPVPTAVGTLHHLVGTSD